MPCSGQAKERRRRRGRGSSAEPGQATASTPTRGGLPLRPRRGAAQDGLLLHDRPERSRDRLSARCPQIGINEAPAADRGEGSLQTTRSRQIPQPHSVSTGRQVPNPADTSCRQLKEREAAGRGRLTPPEPGKTQGARGWGARPSRRSASPQSQPYASSEPRPQARDRMHAFAGNSFGDYFAPSRRGLPRPAARCSLYVPWSPGGAGACKRRIIGTPTSSGDHRGRIDRYEPPPCSARLRDVETPLFHGRQHWCDVSQSGSTPLRIVTTNISPHSLLPWSGLFLFSQGRGEAGNAPSSARQMVLAFSLCVFPKGTPAAVRTTKEVITTVRLSGTTRQTPVSQLSMSAQDITPEGVARQAVCGVCTSRSATSITPPSTSWREGSREGAWLTKMEEVTTMGHDVPASCSKLHPQTSEERCGRGCHEGRVT